MGRAPCCDKANVKRGPWSPEEDATLKDYLHKHGTGGNWISLPQRAGLKRCGKSCRLRWLNYLRPDIKHGAFSEEEDNIIISLYYKMGSRWSVIAANLPGRTDNDVKNHWNTKLKKKLFGSSNNKINNLVNPFTYTNIFQPHYPSSSAPNNTSPTPNLHFPSFSSLLAQCSNSPLDPTRPYNSLNYFHHFTNIGPPEEASSLVYGSSFEDDPFFADLGFGSVMINPDQQDIKPQELAQNMSSSS